MKPALHPRSSPGPASADGGVMSLRPVPIALRAGALAALAAVASAQAPADGASLAWASFFGGGSHDALQALVVDADGTLLVAGTTAGGLPATPGAFDAGWNGGRDACVARLSADGATVLAATYLGGSLDDEARALALDASGYVLVAGFTASADFPTTAGAFDRSFAGGNGTLHADAFVARLAPDLSGLSFGTLLGGTGEDLAAALAVDASGSLFVAGKTSSADFPATPGAHDALYGGGGADVGDAFVARLSASGALLWASYVGGTQDDMANALALDAAGRPVLAGWTRSPAFPATAGAFDASLGGPSDAFVARLAEDGSALQACTLLGGGSDENATALAIAPDGALLLAGTTLSVDFPLAGTPADASYGGGAFLGDVFVARLDAGATQLHDATYLGGAGDEIPTGMRRDAGGALLLSGWTASPDFPLVPAAPGVQGAADAFVVALDLAGGELTLSLLLGGPSADKALACGQRPDGLVVLAGSTTSAAFPVTPGAADTSFGGLENLVGDGFAALLDLGAATGAGAPFTDLGQALAGAGGLAPELLGQGSLQPLAPCALLLQHAAPGAPAVLLVSAQAAGLPFKGGSLLPWPVLVQLALGTDAGGDALLPFAWPAEGAGLQLVLQAWVLDPGGPAGLSASNGLLLQAP